MRLHNSQQNRGQGPQDQNPHVRTTMNATTKRLIANTLYAVHEGTSRNGTPQPSIEVRMPRGTHYRVLTAMLYRVAADVEIATAPNERWVVQTNALMGTRGWVSLELAGGTPEETERGLAVLRSVVGARVAGQ